MERLTEYDEFGNAELIGIDNTKLYERLVCDETVALTIATNKLGKLEDVLEEFGLTSAEDLRNHLNFQDNMAIWERELNYKNKIADLEHELAITEKKIADLEAKLAESEDCNNMLYKCLTEKDIEIETKKEENAELQKQLAEKEEEIAYLTKQVKKFNNEAQKYFEDAYCNDFHNQDKISFAIEQLDNFLKTIHSHEKIYLSLNDFKIINEIFEQQIKQLKEMK